MENKMEEYKYNCNICKFKCNYKSQWEIHIETELHKTGKKKKRSDCKNPYKCEKCNYVTKNIFTFKQHMLNEHSTKKEREEGFKFYCKYCDFGTFSSDLISTHNETEKHRKQIMRQI
jgi:hypothetical protein